jgi:hypothetical protein
MFPRLHITPLQISIIRNLAFTIQYSNATCNILFEFEKTKENVFLYVNECDRSGITQIPAIYTHTCTHIYTYNQMSTYMTPIHREAYISFF